MIEIARRGRTTIRSPESFTTIAIGRKYRRFTWEWWASTTIIAAMIGYTAWCAAYGPPYHDAYGLIIHALFHIS